MDIKIYYNPRTLLDAAGVGWVWDVVFLIILIGLTLSFVSEVFKIQKKEKPDFIGVVWKTVFIVLMYSFLPQIIAGTMSFVSSTVSSQELDAEFYKAFSMFSVNLASSGTVATKIPDGCPQNIDVTLMNAGIQFVSSYSFQYFAKLFLFILMVTVWVVKEVIFSWGWPVMMSINMIGLCSALVMPAFPGQTFGSLGSFFKSVAALSLWPVLYSVFIIITGEALAVTFRITQKTLVCPTVYQVGRDTVTSMSGIVFMAGSVAMIPYFSNKIVHSSQAGELISGIKETRFVKILTQKVNR
jgi:hypothetical protein